MILGFVKVRHSGSHVILRRGPKGCVVSTHSDVKVGTLAGSVRMPVQTLLDYLESGESIDDFLAGFPSVSREQVAAGPLAGLEVCSKWPPGTRAWSCSSNSSERPTG